LRTTPASVLAKAKSNKDNDVGKISGAMAAKSHQAKRFACDGIAHAICS